MSEGSLGQIVRVVGPTVDVKFESGFLPSIQNAQKSETIFALVQKLHVLKFNSDLANLWTYKILIIKKYNAKKLCKKINRNLGACPSYDGLCVDI